MKYLLAIFYCFITWILASAFNGLLCGLVVGYADRSEIDGSLMLMCIFYSFIFSLPAMFFYWIYFMICLSSGIGGQELFRSLTYATLLLSTASGLIFCLVFGGGLFWLVLPSVIIASMASLFIQRSTYLSVFKANENETSL